MKKLVVMLAAIDGLKKGATVEVDAKKAERYIAKGHAVPVDRKVMRAAGEEHGDGDDDEEGDDDERDDAGELERVVSRAVKPLAKAVGDLQADVDELRQGKRTKATKHTDEIDGAEGEEGERDDDETDVADDSAGEQRARSSDYELVARAVVRGLEAERRRGDGVRARSFEFKGTEADAGTGLKLARLIRADAAADKFKVAGGVGEVLRRWGFKGMARRVEDCRKGVQAAGVKRGLNQSTFVDGGALVPEEYSAELIPLLRAANVVRQMGVRTITMGASLTLPKQTGTTTASYIGEAGPVVPSKPALGAMKFSEKKLSVGVVISNDLIKNASISADAWVRDDIVESAKTKEEIQALFGTGTQYSPPGVENLIQSANKFDLTAVDLTNPTLAEMRKFIAKCRRIVKQSKVPMTAPGWIFNARFEAALIGITDGNGNAVYEAQLNAGKLGGYPALTTENIPDNLALYTGAQTDVTRVFFGDWAQFVIAESAEGTEVTVFPDGTYEEGGVVKAGASRDETFVRLLVKHDFNMRYDNAIVVSAHRPA